MNFKTNTIIRTAFILTVCLLPTATWAQATATGDISAEVQEIPITLTLEQPLSLGTFVPFGRSGTVTVNGDGSLSSENVLIVSEGQPASWLVGGTTGAYYDISYTTSTTLTNGSYTMDVTEIHLFSVDGVIFPDSGSGAGDRIHVGATVNVNPNQPPGLYNGTYELSVAYN